MSDLTPVGATSALTDRELEASEMHYGCFVTG
jgi:hypothetical protein